MIKRIDTIKNFGIYQSFVWKDSLKKGGRIVDFQKLNIIYGRNYSGKTTLSRIIRCLETGVKHQDYSLGGFSITMDDDTVVTESSLDKHDSCVRVFNKDFIKDNLAILFVDEAEISTFAILGEANVEVEKKINAVKEKLGSEEEEKGQCYKRKVASDKYNDKKKHHQIQSSALEKKLQAKAKKMKENRNYGVVTYNIKKIEGDIKVVLKDDYTTPTAKKITALEKIIAEVSKDNVSEVEDITIDFSAVYEKTMSCVHSEISARVTIDDLVDNRELQKWVKEGMTHHKERSTCAFCHNKLTSDTWNRLKDHFNEESEKLERQLKVCKESLEQERKVLDDIDLPNKNAFYSEFHERYDVLVTSIDEETKKINAFAEALQDLIDERCEDLFKVVDVDESFGLVESELTEKIKNFNSLVVENNNYTSSLGKKKKSAQQLLRLAEVRTFVEEISYESEAAAVDKTQEECDMAMDEFEKERLAVESLEKELNEYEAELKDESKGAEKVNQYLCNYFGHDSLKLVHVEEGEFGCFQIMRGDEVAKNLSEGESSLIAFCYFMAKLHDLDTKKDETIIWIDDPISSLDSNHIFFIFSLIENELTVPVDTGNGNKYSYRQLFLSTHNLEFLKYLKRLSLPFERVDKRKQELHEYFMIERGEKSSSLTLMPRHLSYYATEFNYLFEKIQECSTADLSKVDYDLFYNFGNNLRKFLESYLFYRYPSKEDHKEKIKKFFGNDGVAQVLVERMSNEMSHAEGQVERGQLPIEMPVLQKVAKFVLAKIEEKDPDQFNAFKKAA